MIFAKQTHSNIHCIIRSQIKYSARPSTWTRTWRRLCQSSVTLLLAQSNARHAIMSLRARYELFEVDPLLHFCANFIVHWIQIWVLGTWGPRLNEMNVSPISDGLNGTHWHRGFVRSVSLHIVLLKDKELAADLAHDTQLIFSQKHVVLIFVR